MSQFRSRFMFGCPLVLLAAALVVSHPASSQTPNATTPPPNLTYDQALLQAVTAEQQSSDGYASIGYSPAILTIPARPFTAHRVYREWDRNTNQPIMTTTVTIARDSVGRIHYESSRDVGQVTVMISDPVQHLNYRYDIPATNPANPTATSCLQPQMSQISGPAPMPDPTSTQPLDPDPAAVAAAQPVPTATKNELGVQAMEGTTAYGQQRIDYLSLQPGIRTMRTLTWFSADLGLNLLEVDNYSGQNLFAISTQQIVPGDPDPALFSIPQGYALSSSTPSCIPLMNSN